MKNLVPKPQNSILLVTKKRYSVGILYCIWCPNFSTKSQDGLNYYTTKKHSAPKPIATFKCELCFQELPGFHALRQQKNTQHDFSIKTANVDPDDIISEVDDMNLTE